MRIYSLGQISAEEKSNILEKHRTIYDGYRTIQPNVSNTQSLYTMDFAGDKNGITVSNKGDVKKYTNVGINEEVSEKEMCSECGGGMYEGECMECGWKGDMGEQTQQVDDLDNVEDLNGEFDYIEDESEMEETQQGNPYAEEKPAYDFVSGGPGKAFREEWSEDEEYMTSAFSDGELDNPEDVNLDDLNDIGDSENLSDFEDVEEKSWTEVDEEIRESFLNQKNLVVEMMNRMKVIK